MLDNQEVLNCFESDGIDHLWVIWHDYNGRSCAKTVSKDRLASVFDKGVVFAKADLDFNLQDHMADNSTFTAETGDFLAVPDPSSYASIPYHDATARMHAFLRTDDGSAWDACPRTQLQRVLEAYKAHGLSVRVSFEAEFILFVPDGEGDFQPADKDLMFTVAGLDRHFSLWQDITHDLQSMGVQVEQLGKEYGPGQYEATTRYAEPLKGVDDYLTFKEVGRAAAFP